MSDSEAHMTAIRDERDSAIRVFMIFLRLGLTSFGGPIAHLGYFRDEFVTRRRWLSERGYADLVALCQFLPGPASSQVGMALGLSRAGYAGALAAWAGFTLPSALLLTLFALGLAHVDPAHASGALHGLEIVAVAVVAQAVSGMARTACTGAARIALMLIVAAIVWWLPNAWTQLGAIAVAALVGLLCFRVDGVQQHDALPLPITRRAGALWLSLCFVLLMTLPLLAHQFPDHSVIAIVDAFYRAGSLVFGGGHVVLPLLQAEVVPTGWVGNDSFLAGYGATQAMPGPLFTFAAFLGASMSGWTGAIVCLIAIFAPAFLLVIGALPFWEQLRRNAHAQAALAAVNAAVVGLLLAALVHPVATSALFTPSDVALALLALVSLMYWKLPPWLVVIGGAAAGALLGAAV